MVPLAQIEAAARDVYAAMLPTPQYAWPLLADPARLEHWLAVTGSQAEAAG